MSRTLVVIFFVSATGCGSRPDTGVAVGTGARDAAREFFTAVVRNDWPAAHGLLAPADRTACPAVEFARRGEAYRKKLGFEPARVLVPVCDEHGGEATARIELTGRGHHFRDAVILRKHDARWFVGLPAGFGRK